MEASTREFDKEQFEQLAKQSLEKHGQIEFYNAVNNIDAEELARARAQTDTQEAARTAKEREEELKLAEGAALAEIPQLSKDVQIGLLRACVRTVGKRLGGADESQGTEALLKSLVDTFLRDAPYETKLDASDFQAALRAEAEAAEHAFPRPKVRYVVKRMCHMMRAKHNKHGKSGNGSLASLTAVKRGQGLAAKDRGGASDPFAYVGVVPANVATVHNYEGAQFQRSSTQPQTLDPVWNETFEFVVSDADSKKLWFELWDEDEGVFSNKGDGDFLGRIQIPLATLPAPTKSAWFELERRSAKSSISGKVELAIFTYPQRTEALSAEAITAATETYLQLDEMFVHADKGLVTDAHEAILAQYISQNDIPFTAVAASRFVSLVRVNLTSRIPANKIADAAERLTKVETELATLPEAHRQELLAAMVAVHKQFECMLWRFPEYFPFEDPDAANQLYDYCDIVNLLIGIPMYRDTLDMHYARPLDAFVKDALVKHGGRVYQRAVARADREGKDPLEQCVILVSVLLAAVQPASSKANPALKQLKLSYVAIVAQQFEAPVRERVFTVVDSLETTSDPNVFSLYFLLQSLASVIAKNPKALPPDQPHLAKFHAHFTRFVADWFRISGEKTREWVVNAITVDRQSTVVADTMFSSSVVDVFAGFAQTYTFLERLKWPDILEYTAFVTMFVEMMCEGLSEYSSRVRENFERQFEALGGSAAINKEQCQLLNNLDITHEKMQEIYEVIDLPKVIIALRALETEFEPPISVLFGEESEQIKEQLDFCLDCLADAMSPEITAYLVQMINSSDNFEGSRIDLVKQMATFSLGDDTNDEPVSEDYMDEKIVPLIQYLDQNLEVLHENLYASVFTAILSRIWSRVNDNIDALIKPKTKQLSLPVSARQASILLSSLERLHDYFYAGGDGIKTAKLDTEDYTSLRQRLAEVFMPTPDLINRFYELEEQAHQAVTTGGAGKADEDAGNGRMEGVITYDSARDTLIVYLQEASNLPAMDDNGLSDPYVIIRVLPDNKAIKPRQSARKTETLNPVYNETFEFKLLGMPLSECTLQFAFYDFDFIGGHDYMGEVVIPLRDITPDEPKRNVWPLTKFSAETAALINPYGTLDVTTLFQPNNKKLKVTVHGAKGLPPMDTNGLCDPYAVLHLLPLDIAANEKAKRTKTLYRTLDPVYNKDFEFEVMFPEQAILQIVLFDYDVTDADDYIGEILVKVNALPVDQPLRKTYTLMATTNNQEVFHIFCVLKKRSKTDPLAYKFVSDKASKFIAAS